MNDTGIPLCSSTGLHIVDAQFGPVASGCRFDFTFTFEQYILSVLPSILFLLAAPIRINVLRKRNRQIDGKKWRGIKLAAIAVLAMLQLATLIIWSTTRAFHALKTPAFVASSLSLVSSFALSALSYYEHSRSLRPSVILNVYLFLTFLFDIAVLRTMWLALPNSAERNLFAASIASKALILLLEAKEKRGHVIRERTGNEARKPSPEETSGIYSQGFMWWLNWLIRTGYKKVLSPMDLYSLDRSLTAEVLHDRFHKQWARESSARNGQPAQSLLRVLLGLLKVPLLLPVLPRLFLLAFTFCQPLLVSRLLAFLTSPSESSNVGYALVGAYFLVYFGISISNSLFLHQNYRFLTQLRGTLVTAIYTTTTDLSLTAIDENAAVTLMSTNVETLILCLRGFHDMWANIVQMVLATYLLERRLGWACIGTVVVVLGTGIVVGLLAPVFSRRQLRWITQVKKRVGITSKVLGHMKGIKILGLTQHIASLLQDLRVEELRLAAKEWRLNAAVASIAYSPQTLAPVATFAFYAIRAGRDGAPLDVERLFTSLALLVLLTQPLFSFFQDVLALSSTLGNLGKIETFLTSRTRNDCRLFQEHRGIESPGQSNIWLASSETMELASMNTASQEQGPLSDEVVRIEDGSFGWKEDAEPTLKNIDCTILRSKVTLLIGPVASGKSTLLKAILGETRNQKGFIHMKETKAAYCDQTPWLTNVSVKDNIVGFSTYDDQVYYSVIHACDLEQDIATFPGAHETIIGSKGVSLSTGQKQRIAIARAVYSRNRFVIFDDVLSGLDVNTQRNVFTRLLGKTVDLLPLADYIIALSSEGTIAEQGTFPELDAANGYVHRLHLEHASDQKDDANTNDSAAVQPSQSAPILNGERPGTDDKSRQLGDWQVYKYYFRIHGPAVTTVFFTLAMGGAFLTTFPTVWLKWYSDANEEEPNKHTAYYLGIYTLLQCLTLINTALYISWSLQIMARRAGVRFHMTMVKSVMSAPMSFFSKSDIGSLTTRFSQDISLLDGQLPLATMMVALGFLTSFASIGLIASGAYYISICFPFLFTVYFFVQRYYLRTSRQMRLLDLEEKAPVYTQFLESLSGLATLRAFGWQRSSISHNHKLVDRSQKPYYLMFMIQTWLTLVLDLITMVLAVLVVGVSVRLRTSVSAGFTGVALVQIVGFTANLKLSIMFWTQMETSIGAVARIKKFEAETENENQVTEVAEPPADWPGTGGIEIENLTVSYGADETARIALDSINLSIQPGQKVAIVGRTGSGKSTLVSALFGLVSISSGRIFIDNLDISTVPRAYVRSRINAISEDQFFLPSSTIRLNLDPYSASTDSALVSALCKTNLWEAIEQAGGLDVEWNDDMLSHGQRQIFCLARALLRPGNVVVLDEVSSAVDRETDGLMQRCIREEFAGKTIIVVAHRVETIRDFDKIVVLADGAVVEAGSPNELMERNTGIFRGMVDRGR